MAASEVDRTFGGDHARGRARTRCRVAGRHRRRLFNSACIASTFHSVRKSGFPAWATLITVRVSRIVSRSDRDLLRRPRPLSGTLVVEDQEASGRYLVIQATIKRRHLMPSSPTIDAGDGSLRSW